MKIQGTCSLESPKSGHLCYFEDEKLLGQLHEAIKLTVITTRELLPKCPEGYFHHIYIISNDPRAEFCRMHNEYHGSFKGFTPTRKWKKRFPGAHIGKGVSIGANTIVYPGAVIMNGTVIGANCVINPGAVIGGEGFSSLLDEQGHAHMIRNVGSVNIGDNVEIGVNTCIDRATFDHTIIGDRVKIDNLVHIAHNCVIGEDTRIVALSGIGGSTRIGRRVWVGFGSTIREHVNIGDDAFICMGSVVIEDVLQEQKVAGNYAMPSRRWMKHWVLTNNTMSNYDQHAQ